MTTPTRPNSCPQCDSPVVWTTCEGMDVGQCKQCGWVTAPVNIPHGRRCAKIDLSEWTKPYPNITKDDLKP